MRLAGIWRRASREPHPFAGNLHLVSVPGVEVHPRDGLPHVPVTGDGYTVVERKRDRPDPDGDRGRCSPYGTGKVQVALVAVGGLFHHQAGIDPVWRDIAGDAPGLPRRRRGHPPQSLLAEVRRGRLTRPHEDQTALTRSAAHPVLTARQAGEHQGHGTRGGRRDAEQGKNTFQG